MSRENWKTVIESEINKILDQPGWYGIIELGFHNKKTGSGKAGIINWQPGDTRVMVSRALTAYLDWLDGQNPNDIKFRINH
jgi:hypothetical protein